MGPFSLGDWHEDMVALYDDTTDSMVCWLQRQGGVDPKALAVIKAAPELLAACTAIAGDCEAIVDGDDFSGMSDQELFGSFLQVLRPAIAKAQGRSE